MEFHTPGVYIREVDSGPKPIMSVATSVPGFMGLFDFSPPDDAIAITGGDGTRQISGKVIPQLVDKAGRVTGDGVEELFVTIFHNYVCGTAGCNTSIFQVSPSGWQKLSSISPMISDIGGPEIFVADEVIDGYRTLHTDYMGLHWNGERYVAYCRRNCSQG